MVLQLGVIATYKVVKGFSYSGIVFDEASKVACCTDELPHASYCCWEAHFGDLFETFLTSVP